MGTLVENATAAIGIINNFRKAVGRPENAEIIIPDGVTIIGQSAFSYFQTLKKVTIPNSVTNIRAYAFSGCYALEEIIIPEGVQSIAQEAFEACMAAENIVLPSTLTLVQYHAFDSCRNCTDLVINMTHGGISIDAFDFCTALTNVTLADGFNVGSLRLSASTHYSAETIVSWLNALADRTGEAAYTLYIGSDNIAKLTAEQIAIATNKNWNLA